MRSVVRIYPGPPTPLQAPTCGAVAQLGEHLLCKQGVNGSIPFSSTKAFWAARADPSCFALRISPAGLDARKTAQAPPKNSHFDFLLQDWRLTQVGLQSGSRLDRSRDRVSPAGFNSPRAGLFATSEKVWMFDNEIDWVTYFGKLTCPPRGA